MKDISIEFDKKARTSFLKSLEFFNNIIKNIYNEVFINSSGIAYNNTSLIHHGRCLCKLEGITDLFPIGENEILRLIPRSIYDCIKGGKSKILGVVIENNNVEFVTTEGSVTIGSYLSEQKLNLEEVEKVYNSPENYKENVDYLKERFKGKEFILLDVGGYKLYVTHKLFPTYNKAENIDMRIFDNNDGTFYSEFNMRSILEFKDKPANRIEVSYLYKFLKI